ncbi:MAG: hypothetical protein QOI24_3198 [Acidobacteriota bacterium]|jgi:capsular polysaccharide biosynthesis protein|nr:hypothetical protein [Acidobacteriota bacterium]
MPVPTEVATDSAAEAVRRIRHRWQIVVVATVVVTLSAWALAELQPKRYRAVAIAALMPNEALQTGDLLRTVDSLERRNIIATVAVLATTPLTHAQVLASLPPQDSQGEYIIDSRVMPNTNLFRIEVEGDDPARAAELANRVPKIIAAQTLQMYKVYGITTVSAATPPAEPSTPRVGRTIAAGFILGLLIGAMLAWGSERFSRRLRTAGF